MSKPQEATRRNAAWRSWLTNMLDPGINLADIFAAGWDARTRDLQENRTIPTPIQLTTIAIVRIPYDIAHGSLAEAMTQAKRAYPTKTIYWDVDNTSKAWLFTIKEYLP